MKRRPNYFYVNVDEGVDPDGAASPWTRTDQNSPTLTQTDDGWDIDATGGGDVLELTHLFYDGSTDARVLVAAPDRLEFQLQMQVAEIGASGAVLMGIYDGYRLFLLDIGASLRAVTSGGVTIASLVESFSPEVWHSYHIIKHQSDCWEIRVDGVAVGRIPYDAANSTNLSPYAYVGVVEARYVVNGLEGGANLTLPPQNKVERAVDTLHPSLLARWTAVHRAFLRAYVGEFEHGSSLLDETFAGLTGGRTRILDRYSFTGKRLPSEEDPAWTCDDGQLSIVRQRVRTDGATGDGTLVADLGSGQAGYAVTYGRVRLIMGTFTIQADNLVIHGITINTDDVLVSASLYKLPDGDVCGWTIREGDHSVADVSMTDRYWQVYPYAEHVVELAVIADEYVLLLVDDAVVDYAPVSAFTSTPASGRTVTISAGQNDTAEGDATADFWDGDAGVYGYDIGRRSVFEQLCVEDLVFVGGCESLPILDAFHRHRWGMLAQRGTVLGMKLDIWRTSCSTRIYIVEESTPSEWYLDLTWPDETPVWLDATGALADHFVEFNILAMNYTLTDYAGMLYRYVVPTSILESQFWICLITAATASISAGSSVSVAVESSQHFEVDDVVTLRDFANTTSETCTIAAIADATHITLATVDSSYSFATATPPIIRKVIRGAHPS